MMQAYFNGPVFTGDEILYDTAVLVEDGIIVSLLSPDQIPSHYVKWDLQSQLLAPALIDLQIYGGNGKMFSQETTVEAIEHTYEYCKSGGAHHFMITLATNSMEIFLKGIEAVKAYWAKGGKGLLGLHLEGPYLNASKKGAHLEKYIHTPSMDEVKQLMQAGRGVVKMMTLAPECCDPAIVRYLQEEGVLISAGHTNATYQEATAAFNNGIPLATHLYNAMSGLQHRAPGMVGAIFDHPAACSSIVCDGIHVDYAAARIAKRIMNERLFYITDAVAEANGGGYAHVFRGDHYALPDGTLSGSALTMMQCVKNGVKHLGISLEESLRMASTYPAQFLKDRKLGRIAKGYEAVFVMMEGSEVNGE